MKILYIGDIMGEVGIHVVERVIPKLKKQKNIDVIIAQAENVSNGKGINVEDYNRLRKLGIDFFTGGNWTLFNPAIIPQLNDPNQPIIRPANYPDGTPGLGYKVISFLNQKILVVSLLGKIVGKDADIQLDNPLQKIDEILDEYKDQNVQAIIVNFHGDYSSEKVVIGHYLDGKATLVIGDHWHVPTADARILPHGTAHITDVGMCGALNASLGVELENIVSRWRDGHKTRNILEKNGPTQFNAVLINSNESGLTDGIEQIQIITQ